MTREAAAGPHAPHAVDTGQYLPTRPASERHGAQILFPHKVGSGKPGSGSSPGVPGGPPSLAHARTRDPTSSRTQPSHLYSAHHRREPAEPRGAEDVTSHGSCAFSPAPRGARCTLALVVLRERSPGVGCSSDPGAGNRLPGLSQGLAPPSI